ncbi:unnamed protein product [Sympodiomycopsis kandeliae]
MPDTDTTRHLLGHPLPACIPLSRTLHSSSEQHTLNSDTDDGSSIDLFMISLSSPILLFCSDQLQSVVGGLEELSRSVDELKTKEQDLKVFGYSTHEDLESLQRLRDESALEFDLLSDPEEQFTKALSLPIISDQPLLLLLREGQVTRAQHVDLKSSSTMTEVRKMLRTDKEVEDDWNREKEGIQS